MNFKVSNVVQMVKKRETTTYQRKIKTSQMYIVIIMDIKVWTKVVKIIDQQLNNVCIDYYSNVYNLHCN